jgi:hypothetical protein
LQPLHAMLSPPVAFLFLIQQSLLLRWQKTEAQPRQCPWQRQREESTTSQVVVGHEDLAFRDWGANETCQSKDASHGRNDPVKKEEA